MRDHIDVRFAYPALPRSAAGPGAPRAAAAGSDVGQAVKIFLMFCVAFLGFFMLFLTYAGCAWADMVLPPGATLLDGGAYLL